MRDSAFSIKYTGAVPTPAGVPSPLPRGYMSALLWNFRLRPLFACASVFLIASLSYLCAQDNFRKPLTDYVVTYADAPGHTIEIVAGNTLFAVVEEPNTPLLTHRVRDL